MSIVKSLHVGEVPEYTHSYECSVCGTTHVHVPRLDHETHEVIGFSNPDSPRIIKLKNIKEEHHDD